MTQNRYDGQKTALYERIQKKQFCDNLTLLTWLVSDLDEWVERLDGALSWSRIEQTEFFAGLMTNIEVLDEVRSASELKQSFPEQDWTEFMNAVTWLEKTRDREELSLVERTYHQFKNRFAAISGQDSSDDAPKSEPVSQPSQVEWWPSSTLRSPIVLRTSRAILSLAILLLLGSVFCFVDFVYGALMDQAHFGQLEGFGDSSGAATRDTGNVAGCLFLLSVLFFTAWSVYRLGFKVARKSQK